MPSLVSTIPTVKTGDWNSLKKAMALVQKNFRKLSSFELGPTAKPTFNTVKLDGLTASSLIAIDADKLIESVSVTANLTYSAATLDTVQDIQTTSSPTFAGLTSGASTFGDGGTTNYAAFAADGELTLAGTARAWKDMDLNPAVVKLPGANPPAEDTKDSFPFHRYDRGTEESVYYSWIIPSDFAAGDGSVKGQFEFLVENPPSGGGNENVRMGFEYKKLSENDVFDFTTGTSSGYIDETIVDGETAEILHLTDKGTCTTTGWAAGDIILFRFYRDATAAEDTYDNEAVGADNDVWVLNYHLEYLVDKLGTAS